MSGWFQTIPLSRSRHKYLHKTALSRYGTPYEQDQEHRPSVSSHQLYSLGTVFLVNKARNLSADVLLGQKSATRR